MLDYFKEYWYLALLLFVAVIFTCWVISKAYKASAESRRIRDEQMKRIDYENGVVRDFSELSEEKLDTAEPKRAFDGVALNIQRQLEKQPDMQAAFFALTDAQRYIYALYYLAEDSEKSLSEFFRCNGAPLTPCAQEAVRMLFPEDAADIFEQEYRAYDPNNEEVSLIPERTERLDAEFKAAMGNFDMYKTCVDYIRKNVTDFLY